jgi:hypothetical protein
MLMLKKRLKRLRDCWFFFFGVFNRNSLTRSFKTGKPVTWFGSLEPTFLSIFPICKLNKWYVENKLID